MNTSQPTTFKAPHWLPSPHAQTIGGRLLRRARTPALARERLSTPDGDFLDLDFAPSQGAATPLVLLLHGLEGSAARGYALNTYQALAQHGISAVGLNFRSCSGELNRTARFYHSGETEDIRLIVNCLRQRYPGRPLAAVGFSLGGNALLKFLGEESERAAGWLRAAVAVSVPYDLATGADHLDQSTMGRFYTRIFVKSLVQKMAAKAELIGSACDLERARRARSFREFDDAVTAPLHGFANADDYYQRSSSAQFLPFVRVPTLLLHAQDDPFLPARWIPQEHVASNSCLSSIITRDGGHVGFIQGKPWKPEFWAEQTAAAFLTQQLG